jgi:hypothetical protein
MGNSTSVVARTRPGSKSEQGGFFSPVPLSPPVASPQHSTTPLLHYSIPHKIPCNLSRRFPLYGVEAGSLPAIAARWIENGADELSTKPAMNMAGAAKDESIPAASGGQGRGGKQRRRPELTSWFGGGFDRAVPEQRAAQVRTTQCQAIWWALDEDRSSGCEALLRQSRARLAGRASVLASPDFPEFPGRFGRDARQSAHSSFSGSDGHSRHKPLSFLVQARARNTSRKGQDIAGQNSAFLLSINDNENLIQEASVRACCVSGADSLKGQSGYGISAHSGRGRANTGGSRLATSCISGTVGCSLTSLIRLTN